MFLIKLGGSVITNKSLDSTFKKDVMDRLAAELKKANKQAVVVHGAGSFGHILAKKYALNEGYKQKKQLQGYALTQAKVQQLNSFVLTSLHNHGIPAVSIPPHAFLSLKNHKPLHVDYTIFEHYLNLGLTPVTFGDVVLDNKLGFSICSGDLLMQLLAVAFKPEKVIFVLDEDGLYSANPKIDRNATFLETATVQQLKRLTTHSNAHADVTRGMEGKIQTIQHIAQKAGSDIILLNGNVHNRLYHTLKGKKERHTIIYGEEA